jgi:hypothetical protein
MLSLDEYINCKNEQKLLNLLKNEKEFENSFNFNSIDLSNLTQEQKIIQIKLYYKISDYLIIKDKIDWDLVFRKKSIENYIDLFLKKLSPYFEKPELIEENKKNLRRQFFEQIINHLIKLNKFPTFHVLDNKYELNGLNELCPKCHTVRINRESCINCYNKFDDESSENYNNNYINKEINTRKNNTSSNTLNKIGEESGKVNMVNERQRTLSLRQKSINIEEGNNGDEKKCKKCGEVNDKYVLYCIKCGDKFPIASCIDSSNINNNIYSIYNKNESESSMICSQINNNYCVYFFEKINKNHIVSQLKDFGIYFHEEDFSSLKYLYLRIKTIIEKYYKDIITIDAYEELMHYLDSIYALFSKPSPTSYKVFNKAYETKYHKERPLVNELNFNDLSDDIKEGWLPENDVNTKYIKQNNTNKNIKIYDNIIRNNNKVDEDDEIIETMMITGGPGATAKKYEGMDSEALLTRRKRGRPKKIDIFKEEAKSQNKEINTVEILPSDRINLLISDIILENNELLHFDFCGECGGQGKLICCETCPTSYHPECVGYDRVPRGKYKCYFCKVAKLGVNQAVTVTRKHVELVHRLFEHDEKCSFWMSVAKDLLFILNKHPCSSFFKEPVPEELEEYYNVVKEPRDLTLIEIKMENWEYKSLHQFLDDLEYVWKDIKLYYKSNSFFWKCADVLERFVQHLIKNEKIFARFESTKYEEITKDQIEMFEKYEKEMKIKRKIEEQNRANRKNMKKSHKKKEKYINIDESYYHGGSRKRERNIEETDEDIIITSSLFRKDDDRNDESTDNVKIVKEVIESSRLNEEDYDITLTDNDNNKEFSEANNKQE